MSPSPRVHPPVIPMLQSLILPLLVAVAVQAPVGAAEERRRRALPLVPRRRARCRSALPSGETRSLFVDQQVVRALGPRRQARLHRLPHRHDGDPARLQAVPDASASSRSPTTRRASAATSPTTARRSTACTTPSIARGDRMAPTCVDCHGAHDVTPPNQPRSRISQTCAACHERRVGDLREERARPRAHRGEERGRADVHRLPPLARHRRARTRPAGGSRAPSSAPAATPTRR